MDAVQKNDPVIKWVDLSAIGVYIGSYRDANKGTGLCIIDMSGQHADKIRSLGFRTAAGNFDDGVYMRPGESITPAILRNVFGADAVKGVEGKRSLIHGAFVAKVREKTKMNANAFFAQQRSIGINHLGEVVQESVIGRYIVRNEDGKPKVVREDDADPAVFLRANNEESLRKIADGFVSRIVIRDEKLRRESVQALIAASNDGKFSPRQYQESIEAALNRLFKAELAKSGATGLEAFDVANRIYIGMPELRERTVSSMANQQYSTPVAMSTLGQVLLARPEELEGASVLEPTIGNASLVTMLGAAKVYGVEIDEERIKQIADSVDGVVLGDATQTHFRNVFGKPEGFDFVIANPPFGRMDSKVEVLLPEGSAVDTLETARLDHLILLRSLHARNDNGRAVFITGADSAIENGEIKGRSKALMNYLFDHYEIEGVTDVSGELFKKQGAEFPTRMYVIGARKPAPEQTPAPEKLQVIRTYEGLREWAQGVLDKEQPMVLNVSDLEVKKKSIENEAESVVEVLDGAKQPWQMTRAEWRAAREEVRVSGVPERVTRGSGSDMVWRIERLEWLIFGVRDHIRARLNAAQKGEVKLNDGEAEDLLELINTPVDHRDVIEKALREGCPVPSGVLAEYPDLIVTAQDADARQESEFQQRYIAFSNVAEPTTMIPANLSGPVYEALAMIKDTNGDIDEFVARELDFAVGDLGKYFSPEQVDALAMIFSSHDRNLGFLLADQMGVGKGRVLAGVARRERLSGRIPTFITVKDNLFSDFLERDIEAIDSRHLFQNPLIINDGSKTVDANGDVVVRSLKRDAYRKHAEAGELPPGTDLVMLTYSQICRKPESHLTSRYMGFLAERYPLSLLLDESHNGAGASNTGINLRYMIEAMGKEGNVVYSSGTPIKGAANLQLYKKILPQGVNPDELLAVVKSDPLALQEALNYEIAAQGCLISRELDSTGIEKQFVVSPNIERNRAIADQMAEILTAMSYLSGDVSKTVTRLQKEFTKELEKLEEHQRDGQRMMASSMNFGSRLYQLNRQFLLALKAKDVVEYAKQSIDENKKPIIALQHTGESLLVDFVTKANEVYDDDPDRVQKTFSTVHLDQPVTFKDLMKKYLEKIQWIKIQGRYGDVRYEHASVSKDSPEASEAFKESVDRVMAMIEHLPDDLPLTPIDYVRHELGKSGITVGEISGRNLQATYLDNGGIMIEPVPGRGDKTRVNRAVREFNNGDLDVLVLTGSGSTGLSVQANPALGRDVRQRVMIKWEMQPDIAQERQMDGRPNRTGQVVKPEYLIPMTGLPADDRVAMMFNNKNRSLTSSTVANRDSKELIREVPDLLNVVGDQVAEELLYETPALADHLDIQLPSDADERALKPPLWYINKLTGRISLLKVKEQEALYGELQSRFTERLDKLRAEGRNPLEVECMDWKARVLDRELFMGDDSATSDKKRSQFDAAVYLTTLEYEQVLKAVRADEIDGKIAANTEGVSSLAASGEVSLFQGITEHLEKNREGLLARHLGRKFKTIDEALNDKDSNEVKVTAAKIDWLLENLPNLGYGSIYLEKDLEGKMVPHVVLRVNPPTKVEGYTRLSDYLMYTMQPGSDLVQVNTLSSLFSKDGMIEPLRLKDHAIVRAEFDNAENGTIKKKARVLDGNLFESVSINLRERIGSKIVYTDESGARQHGILVHSEISARKLASLAERVRDHGLLAKVAELAPITTNTAGETYGKEAQYDVIIERNRQGEAEIRVPGSKLHGGHIFLDPVLSKITGKEKRDKFGLNFSSSGGRMKAVVPERKLSGLIHYLVEEKGLNFYVKDRMALKKAREARKTSGFDHATSYN